MSILIPNPLIVPPSLDAIQGVETMVDLRQITYGGESRLSVSALSGYLGAVTESRVQWLSVPNDTSMAFRTNEAAIGVGEPYLQTESGLFVKAANSGTGRTLRICLIGDSITAAAGAHYPNRVQAVLAGMGYTLTMQGNVVPAGSNPGVAVQAYPGGTITWWATDPASPFVPSFANYVATVLGGTAPDVVVSLLGINDVATATAAQAIQFARNAMYDAIKLTRNILSANATTKVVWLPLLGLGAVATPALKYARAAFNMFLLETFGNKQLDRVWVGSTCTLPDPSEFVDNVHPLPSGSVRLGNSAAATIAKADQQ